MTTTTDYTRYYNAGRTAALQGCYRFIFCPPPEAEYAEWLAGWDSVSKAERGSVEPVKAKVKGNNGN